ncbi:MAG: HlyD family efflux transporter periplasmic adaptor subunit [Gammaproteobacteria bacterium]|nr:HlyD family efflux transporter periplasmic adaptor subunit [Gammaproteobacteria bacterium]
MNKRSLIALSACALLSACSTSEESARVVGELASDRIEISADTNEPIVEILVSEGQSVTAGRVLVRQDTARAASRLAEAEAALAQQQARLDELVRGPRREQIAAARASVEGATQERAYRESELARIREVHTKGLASAEALDAAKAALDAATANHKLALAQLEERLTGTTIEELQQAEQTVNQAAARRDSATVDLERHTLTSPVDGIVDSRLLELGERPIQGQPVMVVLGGKQPYARVFVPEDFRVRVSAGVDALIHVDGLTAPIPGRVRWVSSEAAFTPYFALTERDRGRLSYVAKVDINEERDRLPDGIPVEVEFLVDSGKDAF